MKNYFGQVLCVPLNSTISSVESISTSDGNSIKRLNPEVKLNPSLDKYLNDGWEIISIQAEQVGGETNKGQYYLLTVLVAIIGFPIRNSDKITALTNISISCFFKKRDVPDNSDDPNWYANKAYNNHRNIAIARLQEKGVLTVAQLLELKEYDLLKIKGFGSKSLKIIVDGLTEKGLKLKV